MMTSRELAESMKSEILELMDDGVIPHDVRDFSTLHEFVDANCLGRMEALLDELSDLYAANGEPISGEVFTKSMEEFLAIANPAIESVNFWLQSRKAGSCQPLTGGRSGCYLMMIGSIHFGNDLLPRSVTAVTARRPAGTCVRKRLVNQTPRTVRKSRQYRE
jgi:hypothetical protein